MSISHLVAMGDAAAKLSPEQIAAIVAAPDAADAVTAKVLSNGPKRQTGTKATPSAPAEVKSNVNPMLLANGKLREHTIGTPVPSEGVVFLVSPTWGKDHKLRTNGAAAVPYVDGSPARSMSKLVILALTPDTVEALANAEDTVSKRALIGTYRPVKADAAKS